MIDDKVGYNIIDMYKVGFRIRPRIGKQGIYIVLILIENQFNINYSNGLPWTMPHSNNPGMFVSI